MLTPQQVAERARRAIAVNGERPAWELAHIEELRRVGGDNVSGWAEAADENRYKDYRRQLTRLLFMPPRYWQGWEIEDDLLIWYQFRDLLPAPVQDHLKTYWETWLQPDLPTSSFVMPHSRESVDYWKRTRDWRGHASFFRAGYNFAVSTQNFNHTAAVGALLGGAMIGAEKAMDDGRHGLETLLLRFWAFLDGSTQEMLDHYYLSITLSAQKMLADFAPAPIDRLMGRILTDRTMEMLVTIYHSQTRRFVSSSTRARMPGVLIEQDGIYGALHTVSKDGAVTYADRPHDTKIHGMPVWGYDFPPGRVAMQSLRQPWAPSWVAGLIDDKPVPFEETATETTRSNFKPPLWRRTWLGRWHGLASADIRGGTVDVMAQWVRAPKKSTRLEDLGTLTVRYTANEPDLTTTSEGGVWPPGLTLTFQSANRAIVFAKPHGNRERLMMGFGKATSISKLATVIGLWNFMPKPDWEIFIDDRKVTGFPQRLTAKQRILIRDGVTYLAILPLPSADLGRDVEIEIGTGGGGKTPPTNAEIAPATSRSRWPSSTSRPSWAAPMAASCWRWAIQSSTAASRLSPSISAPPSSPPPGRRTTAASTSPIAPARTRWRRASPAISASPRNITMSSIPARRRRRSPIAGLTASGPTCRPGSSATRAGRSRARRAGWRRTARCSRPIPVARPISWPIQRAALPSATIPCPTRSPGRSRRATASRSAPTAG